MYSLEEEKPLNRLILSRQLLELFLGLKGPAARAVNAEGKNDYCYILNCCSSNFSWDLMFLFLRLSFVKLFSWWVFISTQSVSFLALYGWIYIYLNKSGEHYFSYAFYYYYYYYSYYEWIKASKYWWFFLLYEASGD